MRGKLIERTECEQSWDWWMLEQRWRERGKEGGWRRDGKRKVGIDMGRRKQHQSSSQPRVHVHGGRWRDGEGGEESDGGERTAGGGRAEKLKWLSRSLFPSLLVTLVFYLSVLPSFSFPQSFHPTFHWSITPSSFLLSSHMEAEHGKDKTRDEGNMSFQVKVVFLLKDFNM